MVMKPKCPNCGKLEKEIEKWKKKRDNMYSDWVSVVEELEETDRQISELRKNNKAIMGEVLEVNAE